MDEALHFDDETLVNYLDGELEPKERAIIEEKIKADEALRARVLNLQMGIMAVKKYGTSARVKSIHYEMMQELAQAQKTGKVFSIKNIFKYGAAVAASVIVLVVSIKFFTNSKPTADAWYKEVFVDYDASGVRGQQTTSGVQTNYQDKNYNAVINNKEHLNLAQKDSLLIGLSYLKLNQPANAIVWFQKLVATGSVTDDAEFYLALSYLKNKNLTEALKIVQRIEENQEHTYHNQITPEQVKELEEMAKN